MRTYSYAQALLSSQFKGYWFRVTSEGCETVKNCVVANIAFSPHSGPNNNTLKDLPICRLTLLQLGAGLKSVSIQVSSNKEKKEFLIEFRLDVDQAPAAAPADNEDYVLFSDLLRSIQDKFNGVQSQEGITDFFSLVERLEWESQKNVLKKERSKAKSTSWTSILLYTTAAILLLGGASLLLKKKD